MRLGIDMLCVLGGFLTGADIGIVTAVMAFFIAPILSAVKRFNKERTVERLNAVKTAHRQKAASSNVLALKLKKDFQR